MTEKIEYIFFLFILVSLVMSSCRNSKQSVLVTAHRGASGLAPENTISAMLKAIELGADYSELDVQETSDGVVILLHDNTFYFINSLFC